MPIPATPRFRALAPWLLVAAGYAPIASGANKTELFKCSDAAGAISIQSDPCAKGSTQVWRRDAAAEPAPTPEQAAKAQARRARDERAVRELSEEVERRLHPEPLAPVKEAEATTADPVAAETVSGPNRCEKAQDLARELRGMPWLELSADQSRRLHAWVATECQAIGLED